MKTVRFLLVSIFILLSASSGLLGYWAFEPMRTHSAVVSQHTADEYGRPKTQFKAGETLYVERRLIAYSLKNEKQVLRMIVYTKTGEIVYRDSVVPLALPLGESDRNVRIKLPEHIPSGAYLFRIIVEYHLNPLRDAWYEFTPIEFEVIP